MRLFGFIKQVAKGFGQDKIGLLSSAFAYSAIFSLGALLLVLLSIIGFVFGEQAASGLLFTRLADVVGADTAKTLQDAVIQTNQTGAGVVALVLGTVGALLGAAGMTSQLQNAFNTILGVVPDPKGGIKRTVYVKLKNISLVIFGGIIVAASLLVSALIAGLGNKVQDQIGVPPIALEVLNNSVSLLILITLLFFMYRVIPDVIVPKKILWVTSLIVAFMFVLGKFLLAMIIGNNGTASAYGAAASLISLLLWIYYSGQILFLGAEGVKVYAFNNSIDFKTKKFSLRRTTLQLDDKNFGTKLTQAWLRGFRKADHK